MWLPPMPDQPVTMPMPAAPLPPDDGACCGNGCEQCVWTLYQAELEGYRCALAVWQNQNPGCGPSGGKSAHG